VKSQVDQRPLVALVPGRKFSDLLRGRHNMQRSLVGVSAMDAPLSYDYRVEGSAQGSREVKEPARLRHLL
jgi:hypothetical protein